MSNSAPAHTFRPPADTVRVPGTRDFWLFNCIKEMNKCGSFHQSRSSTWLSSRPCNFVHGRPFPSILFPCLCKSKKPLKLFKNVRIARTAIIPGEILGSDKAKRSRLSQHAAKPQIQLREQTFYARPAQNVALTLFSFSKKAGKR